MPRGDSRFFGSGSGGQGVVLGKERHLFKQVQPLGHGLRALAGVCGQAPHEQGLQFGRYRDAYLAGGRQGVRLVVMEGEDPFRRLGRH